MEDLIQQIKEHNQELDELDTEILIKRAIAFMAHDKPRVGDFVDFSNGVTRRICLFHETEELQTADIDAGSFFLYEGSASFSGTLCGCIPIAELIRTEEVRMGKFWFFHHGEVKAYNGVRFVSPCRVWKTALEAGIF